MSPLRGNVFHTVSFDSLGDLGAAIPIELSDQVFVCECRIVRGPDPHDALVHRPDGVTGLAQVQFVGQASGVHGQVEVRKSNLVRIL